METNLISIVVAYNEVDDVINCIDRIIENTDQAIVVVDNSDRSMTALIRRLDKLSVPIHYLRAKRNIGSAGGFALGMRYAIDELQADWVWLHDQDGYPSPECLANMSSPACGSCVGIVAPVIRSIERGDVHVGFRAKMNIFGYPVGLNDARLGKKSWRELDLVGSAGIAISAELIKQVGTYDRNFFVGYEDYEFSQRARKRNWRIVLAENADYFHPDLFAKYGLRTGKVPGGLTEWLRPLFLPLGGRGGQSKVKELTIILTRYRCAPFRFVSIIYSLCRNLWRTNGRSSRVTAREFIRETQRGTEAQMLLVDEWRPFVLTINKMGLKG